MAEAINRISEAVKMNKQGMEEVVNAQTVMMQSFQNASRRWLDRWQAEAQLLSEFGAKLSASRSFTDTAAAYQEFAQRQWEMAKCPNDRCPPNRLSRCGAPLLHRASDHAGTDQDGEGSNEALTSQVLVGEPFPDGIGKRLLISDKGVATQARGP